MLEEAALETVGLVLHVIFVEKGRAAKLVLLLGDDCCFEGLAELLVVGQHGSLCIKVRCAC